MGEKTNNIKYSELDIIDIINKALFNFRTNDINYALKNSLKEFRNLLHSSSAFIIFGNKFSYLSEIEIEYPKLKKKQSSKEKIRQKNIFFDKNFLKCIKKDNFSIFKQECVKTNSKKNIFKLTKSHNVFIAPILLKEEIVGLVVFNDINEKIYENKTLYPYFLTFIQIFSNAVHCYVANMEFEKSRTHLEAIYNHSTDGIVLMDIKTRTFVEVNPKLGDMLGYSQKELFGMHMSKIHPKEALPYVIAQSNKQVNKRIDIAKDIPVLRKNGEIFYADVNSTPVTINSNKYLLGAFRDITVRKNFENELMVKDWAIKSSNSAIVFINLEGMISFSNDAFLKLFGYKNKQNVLNKSFISFFRDKNIVDMALDQLILHKNINCECVGVTKDKQFLDVQLHLHIVLNERKFPICYFASILDITKQKQIEKDKEMLKRQIFLSEKLASIGTLAGGFAHEFNNILASICTEAEAALELGDFDFQQSSLKNILEAGDSASVIIKNLLNFSRTSALEKKRENIITLINNTIRLLKQELKNKRIQINAKLNKVPLLYIDPQKMQQVFLNIILNSRDAMPNGGNITILAYKKKKNVFIHIKDDGLGIPKHLVSQVFDPFFTTKGPYGKKHSGGGTGLGMSVALGIIQSHKGDIQVISKINKGSEFIIKLPIS